MAPEIPPNSEEAEEETASSLHDGLGPAATAAADPVAPTGQQDEDEPQSPPTFSINSQAAPESLDPRTLRLLWGQRELELQALRWTVQGGRTAQSHHILQEVAGLPRESSRNWEKVLQNQVQKLTLELREQKGRAQLEKEHLEQRLRRAVERLQQLEAELLTLRRSCLLKLAHSSWVGRILRSQTGSVEVVTAETLMDPSDSSETELVPVREGFQLKDVDWNSIAQRYPNLFADVDFSEYRQSLQPPKDEEDSESRPERVAGHTKSVEWHILPLRSSSSGATGSDTTSSQLSVPSHVQKVTGHPPGEFSCSSDQGTKGQEKTLGTEAQAVPADLQKAHAEEADRTALLSKACKDADHWAHWLPGRWTDSSLRIVAVSHREKFVRILNLSSETADLGGFLLQQSVGSFPVSSYRFPLGTCLAPSHHLTVWGETARRTQKRPPVPLGPGPISFHSSRGCVTRLLNPKGEVLSEYQAPHCVTTVSRDFQDNTDLSVDCFPLAEGPPDPNTCEKRLRSPSRHKGRVRVSRAKRRRPRTKVGLPSLSSEKPVHPQEVLPRQPEGANTQALDPLPAIPKARPGFDCSQPRKEHRVRVCRKGVDLSCPMVALSVQSTAESRYGFRFLSSPPVTVDTCGRV